MEREKDCTNDMKRKEIHFGILETDDRTRLAAAPLNETENSSFEGRSVEIISDEIIVFDLIFMAGHITKPTVAKSHTNSLLRKLCENRHY